MWSVNSEVLVTDLGEELILLNPQNSEMFSLNFTSRELWLALPADQETLAHQLAEDYGLSPEQAQADVAALIQELAARQLIRQANG